MDRSNNSVRPAPRRKLQVEPRSVDPRWLGIEETAALSEFCESLAQAGSTRRPRKELRQAAVERLGL